MTSVDISERQLNVARRRALPARSRGPISACRCAGLVGLDDAAFDIVYTGGHVAVWVSDLGRHYAEAAPSRPMRRRAAARQGRLRQSRRGRARRPGVAEEHEAELDADRLDAAELNDLRRLIAEGGAEQGEAGGPTTAP
jgi:hypothetical protein